MITKRPPYLTKSLKHVESMYKFDGVDDRILIQNDNLDLNNLVSQNFSISFFFYPDLAASDFEVLFQIGERNISPASNKGFYISTSGGGGIYFEFTRSDSFDNRVTTTFVDSVNDSKVPRGQISHIVFTKDNSNTAAGVKCYQNSRLLEVDFTTVDNFVDDLVDIPNQINIGSALISNGTTTQHLDGMISNVMMFNKVLSYDEVFSLYRWNLLLDSAAANLLCYYPLSERYINGQSSLGYLDM